MFPAADQIGKAFAKVGEGFKPAAIKLGRDLARLNEAAGLAATSRGRRLTSAERAGIRYLARSPQCGPFLSAR